VPRPINSTVTVVGSDIKSRDKPLRHYLPSVDLHRIILCYRSLVTSVAMAKLALLLCALLAIAATVIATNPSGGSAVVSRKLPY